jgi:AcrR family transcriptional regulator
MSKATETTEVAGSPAAPLPDKDRVEEYLAVALDLFSERNFASVTIKDIAAALGVNSALLYYYFDDKADLFRATIDYAVRIAFATMSRFETDRADPEELVVAWLANHVERYAEIHSFVKIALDFRSSRMRDPAIEAAIASFYAKERRLLSGLIRRGVRQGRFRLVNAARTAQFISTHLDGCMVRAVILPDFDLAVAVRDLERRVLEMLRHERP